MKTQRYTLEELFEDKELEQFIIPEIQRDYVWENKDVNDLLQYIWEGFEGGKEDKPYLGFIYAYTDRDYQFKYFLIDGQQRMTTVFLLLLAVNLKMKRPLPEYLIDQHILKIDYRVRQSTHDFFTDLVSFCVNNLENFDFSVTEQMWYHDEYATDRSIQNLVSNFDFIRKWLGKIDDLDRFRTFLENEVEISYYHINDGRQGEDLYIYMNSRGRQLEPNETLKARYLSSVGDKHYWGEEWERWQDFFWKHRLNRADADDGFNDFLRMTQIIIMAEQNHSSDTISNFVRGRGDQTLKPEHLPKTADELKLFFDAFEWITSSPVFGDFFDKYENRDYLLITPGIDKAQIFYFRLLPVLAFVVKSGCRDEKAVWRFFRFFYNTSRKKNSVAKDIGSQLPIAIRLMHEFAQANIGTDVASLVDFRIRRTVLLDDEEALKLSLYRTPPDTVSRDQMEKLFWEIEDHTIFDGEIEFFLKQHYDFKKGKLNFGKLTKTWRVFDDLFNSKRDNYLIILALLQYGNTWNRESPLYYLNYNCIAWYEIVRSENGRYLMQLLEDLASKKFNSLPEIIEQKSLEYFSIRNFNDVQAIKAEVDLYKQVKILAILDYFSEQKMFKGGNYYIANDSRFSYGDKSFFDNKVVIHNVKRYIDNGQHGRLIPMLASILDNENKLLQLVKKINSSIKP